jgi:1,4-dihydroxy-2-naphthoyl-CoA hydrolase
LNEPIWYNKKINLTDLRSLVSGTMSNHLGMEWVELGPDFLKMKMPVDERTKQPYGLLHGGASCALAETVGSFGSHLIIDPAEFICVGLEINANHIRSVSSGYVIATAIPLHTGNTTHVWDIKINDENDKLISVCRLTVAVLKKKN